MEIFDAKYFDWIRRDYRVRRVRGRACRSAVAGRKFAAAQPREIKIAEPHYLGEVSDGFRGVGILGCKRMTETPERWVGMSIDHENVLSHCVCRSVSHQERNSGKLMRPS